MPKNQADDTLPLILQAAAFAAERHRNQRRKDEEASPYINHPLALACLLANEEQVRDSTVLIAALLHDTVEDTGTTFEELDEVNACALYLSPAALSSETSTPAQSPGSAAPGAADPAADPPSASPGPGHVRAPRFEAIRVL
jgi:hypothetical protein